MRKRKKKQAGKQGQRLGERQMQELARLHFPATEGRKRPRSAAKAAHFKALDEKTGGTWGDMSPHVPVSETDPGAGTWGLDETGREITWFPAHQKAKGKK